MNVQVNLIRSSEQRSASMLSLKSIGKIAGFAVPAVLLLLILLNANAYWSLRSEERLLEDVWKDVSAKQAEALTLEQQLRAHRAMNEELQEWRKGVLEWHRMLDTLRTLVPECMQLRTLNAEQSMGRIEDKPARLLTLRLTGRCTGEGAEQRIEALRHGIQTTPPFADLVARVTVSGFREDPSPAAGEHDRVFQINVEFLPR